MRARVIDGVQIPEALIAQEAQNHPGAGGAESFAAAGHALAVKALLLNRAHELGLVPDPEWDGSGRQETDEEALVRAVLEVELDVAAPTEAERRRVYEAHPDRFRTPTLYEASHILFAPAEPSEAEDARCMSAAQAALIELAADPAGFTRIAKGVSDCPSGQVGGSLGQLRTGDLAPEVESALLRLSPGQTAAAPVRSRFGWHILQLARRIEGRRLPFDQVSDQIGLHLESRAWTAAATRYVSDLARDARREGVAIVLAPEGNLSGGGVTLGRMLTDEGAARRLEPWLSDADPELLERARQAAAGAGQSLADFVRLQTVAFVDGADDEAWTQLISAAQGAVDPALAGLASILKARLVAAPRLRTVIRRAPK